MELTDEQWKVIEPFLPELPSGNPEDLGVVIEKC